MEYYRYVRQENGGVFVYLALFEPALGVDLPDEVVEHSTFREILIIGIDLVCWSSVRYIAHNTPICCSELHTLFH